MDDHSKRRISPTGRAASQHRAAQAKMVSADRALDRLGEEIAQFQVDFRRFFSGDLPLPPQELREAIDRHLRMLRERNLTRAADRFRLGSLEARFNSYNELFNRRLRDTEEGRLAGARPTAPAPLPRYDVDKGVVIGAEPPPGAVEAIYQGLVSRGGSSKMGLETFRDYLHRQLAAIREKTGCERVQFRLTSQEGKITLKARPVRATAAFRSSTR